MQDDHDEIEKNVDIDSEMSADLESELLEESEQIENLPAVRGDFEVDLYKTDKFLPAKGLQSDAFELYLKEISKYELLSQEKEKELINRLQETGDIDAAKKLVIANLRLVVKIAMEYRFAYQNIMDLIQEGNIGLMKAVSKYDPSKGAKLSYYASWWIRSYILKFILDNFRLVKIGTTNEQKKLFYNLLKEKERLLALGIEADGKVLAQNLGVSEKSVALMDQRLGGLGGEISIDRPLSSDVESGTLQDILASDGPSLEEQVSESQGLDLLKKHLKDFVDGLKPRDREIFQKRLLTEAPESLQSIANEYGVSRERIRQIEERLMNNLKVYMSEFIR